MDRKNDVRQLIAEVAEIPPGFDSSAHLYLDLGLPSVKAMELLMALESRFDIHVPDDDFVQANTLDELTCMVEKLER